MDGQGEYINTHERTIWSTHLKLFWSSHVHYLMSNIPFVEEFSLVFIGLFPVTVV